MRRLQCVFAAAVIASLSGGQAGADPTLDAKFKMIKCVSELAPKSASSKATVDSLADEITDRCMALLTDPPCELDPNVSREASDAECRHMAADIRMRIRPPVHDTTWGLITTMRQSQAVAPAPSASVSTSTSTKNDCAHTVSKDGYFIRAQSRCGFPVFPSQLASAARVCNSHMDSSTTVRLFREGMRNFDQAEKAKGHKAVCATFSAWRG